PGMMPKHYAPSTPLIITRDIRSYSQRSDVGCILLRRSSSAFRGPVEYLSCDGDLREAAGNLYRAMRLLDAMSLSLIAVERVPDTGLGAAINDRLSRAASKSFSGTEP
ncbi:MAG TPA: Sua5 family C-terminal domain-containing protein, partial [Sedimentisphaerales bacterium]|nr:Sua5 family C-terminal domain-containing protein [Sedimentisphaerales bacterium]